MNGTVSKVNKKSISHLTQAKRTPSAAATVQVSHALPAVRSLVLTAGPVSKMASQQEKAFCVLRFEVSRSVITVQRARFRKDAPCMVHTESLFLLRRRLGNWPRSKHEKRTAGSAWETRTVAAADGVRCARVRWEINFLLTFETAPFFWVFPV